MESNLVPQADVFGDQAAKAESMSTLAVGPSATDTPQTLPMRIALAVAIVSGCVALGLLTRPGVEAYVLASCPVAIGVQRWLRAQPVAQMWVRQGSALRLGARPALGAVCCAVAPAVAAVTALRAGSWMAGVLALAAVSGAVPLAYAVTELSAARQRSLVALGVIGGLVVAGCGVVVRAESGIGAWVEAVVVTGQTLVVYVPAMFLVEEVFFRGVLDPLVCDPAADSPAVRMSTAALGGALWGLWHLPLHPGAGLAGALALAGIHVVLAAPLTWLARRTGGLAHSAIAHALIDAARNVALLV